MARVTVGGRSYEVQVRGDVVVVDGHEFPVTVREEKGYTLVNSGGVGYRVQLPPAGERASGMTVDVDYRPFVVEYEGRLGGGPSPRTPRPAGGAAPSTAGSATVAGAVAAQIAGRVITVKVKVGDSVSRGDVLLLLEAMKMENEVKAPADGTVNQVLVSDGQRVSEGEGLIVLG
ncbi:MAG: biotin/lipoyl-containing protein [Tepidiformaceae bacterium]